MFNEKRLMLQITYSIGSTVIMGFCVPENWLPANLYIALIPSQNTIQARIELTEMTFIVEMNYLEINFAESKLRVEIENMGKNKTRFGWGFPCQSSTMCSHRVLCWTQSKHSGGSVPPPSLCFCKFEEVQSFSPGAASCWTANTGSQPAHFPDIAEIVGVCQKHSDIAERV